jgi:diguanylate cyclase (GGDEF)-like protein
MLAMLLERRAARLAIIGSVLGLVALAGLAFGASACTKQATTTVRELNQVNDAWGQVFERVNLEEDATRDFLRAGSAVGRQPLASAVGSATPSVNWLEKYGDPDDRQATTLVKTTYASYTTTLRELLAMDARGASLTELQNVAVQADLAATSLRKQTSASIDRQRLELTSYLDQVERRNRQFRVASAAVFAVDLCLLSLSGAVLLSYQRRLERQATLSRRQALHDPLTGLANRVLLSDRTERALAGASRSGQQVGLLLLDLNRFKQVNDTLGHHYGDLLLIEVASRVSTAIRESDTVARLGGDEFGVLLPDIGSVAKATAVAQRIREMIEEPFTLDDHVLRVGASVGVSVFPLHGHDPVDLLRHADAAMYAAKRGHLGVVVHVPDASSSSADLLGAEPESGPNGDARAGPSGASVGEIRADPVALNPAGGQA